MRPVETIPEMGGGRIRENDRGMNSSMIHLIYCENLYKCHNVSLPNRTIKIINK
jgi:hypothetical protein